MYKGLLSLFGGNVVVSCDIVSEWLEIDARGVFGSGLIDVYDISDYCEAYNILLPEEFPILPKFHNLLELSNMFNIPIKIAMQDFEGAAKLVKPELIYVIETELFLSKYNIRAQYAKYFKIQEMLEQESTREVKQEVKLYVTFEEACSLLKLPSPTLLMVPISKGELVVRNGKLYNLIFMRYMDSQRGKLGLGHSPKFANKARAMAEYAM